MNEEQEEEEKKEEVELIPICCPDCSSKRLQLLAVETIKGRSICIDLLCLDCGLWSVLGYDNLQFKKPVKKLKEEDKFYVA